MGRQIMLTLNWICVICILYTRGRCLASLIIVHHLKTQCHVTPLAGPLCIVQCYENVDMLWTECLQVWSLQTDKKARGAEQSFTTGTRLNPGFTYSSSPGYVEKTSKQIQGDLWTVAGGLLCGWLCDFQPVILLCGRSQAVWLHWRLISQITGC